MGSSAERGGEESADQQPWGPRGGFSHHRQTTQQQQQQLSGTHTAASPRAGHAFKLYSECVLAGQWVRLTVQQRQDGEYVTLVSRPLAAAATAAAARSQRKSVRKPNL